MLKLIRYFNETEVEEAIKEAKDGVDNYIEIMKLFNNPNINVSEDNDFQRRFKGFYRIIKRTEEFYNAYFSFMESGKLSKPTFTDTLDYLYKIGIPRKNKNKEEIIIHLLEFSFSSKLLATHNPNLPIWDSNVFICFNLNNPGNWLSKERRIVKANEIYIDLINWYEDFLRSEEGQKWIKLFDKEYSELKSNITPIKKIDFILWQRGANITRDNRGKANP
jgi:hypothetical protein